MRSRRAATPPTAAEAPRASTESGGSAARAGAVSSTSAHDSLTSCAEQAGGWGLTLTETGEAWIEAEWDEWGNLTSLRLDGAEAEASEWPIPQGFAGGLFDPTTGLTRFGARDYDPALGRWTAKDPILFQGGQGNLYVYVGNDPVQFVDPEGRIRTTPAFDSAYPKASARIHSLQHRLTNLHYLAYNVFGGASDRTIRNAFGRGGGPLATDEVLYGASGRFRPGRPNELALSQSLLADYEAGDISDEFLDRVLLHEMTHYFDNMDGRRYPGEAGNEFEKACLGGVEGRK